MKALKNKEPRELSPGSPSNFHFSFWVPGACRRFSGLAAGIIIRPSLSLTRVFVLLLLGTAYPCDSRCLRPRVPILSFFSFFEYSRSPSTVSPVSHLQFLSILDSIQHLTETFPFHRLHSHVSYLLAFFFASHFIFPVAFTIPLALYLEGNIRPKMTRMIFLFSMPFLGT